MNTSSVQIKEPVPIPVATGAREVNSSPAMVSKPPGSTLFAVPLATLMALANLLRMCTFSSSAFA